MTISLVTLSAVTEPFHKNRGTPACHDYIGTQKVHSHLLDNKHILDNCTTDVTLTNVTALNGSMVNQSGLAANLHKILNNDNITNNTKSSRHLPPINSTIFTNSLNSKNNTQSHKMDNLRTRKLCSNNNSSAIQPGGDTERNINIEEITDSLKYTCLAALMMFVVGYAVGYGPSKLINSIVIMDVVFNW